MAEIIKARVWQKVDTEAEWNDNPLILGPGEQAFVVSSAGVPINFKIGDGAKRFSDLPWYFDAIAKAGFFGSASPSDSPAPASGDGFWIVSEAGTYTNFGGVTLPPDKYGFIARVGGIYELIEADVDLSGFVEKAEIVDNLTTEDPSKPLSANMGAVIEPRILPDGNEFLNIDRPDLDPKFGGIIEVDKDGYIIELPISEKVIANDRTDRPDIISVSVDKDGYIIEEKRAGLIGDDKSKLIVLQDVDRPDLVFVVVDKNKNIITEIKSTSKSAPPLEALTPIKQIDPPVQDSFSILSDFLTDYSVFEQAWKDLMDSQVINPDVDPYVSRTLEGKSSTKNLNIWRYDFKPRNPKKKVILLAGTHASEKVYIQGMYNFFKLLLDPDIWTSNDDLRRLRFDIHWVVIPCLSPSAFTGFEEGSIGGRRPWETDDFPVSWTKSGSVVTISFNTADFPDTGGRLDADTYFSHDGLVGKLQVALFESSDVISLPNDGYLIQSVIDGKTITVNTASAAGSTSGTARMYVGVDPNRNMDVEPSTTWTNFTSSSSRVKYSNDYVELPNDNKGTRPFSLAETTILKSIIERNTDATYLLDMHSGAGKNYMSRAGIYKPTGYDDALENAKYFTAQFSDVDFSNIRTDGSSTPFLSNYLARGFSLAGLTIEWNQIALIDEHEATASLRWATSIITEMLNIKK